MVNFVVGVEPSTVPTLVVDDGDGVESLSHQTTLELSPGVMDALADVP